MGNQFTYEIPEALMQLNTNPNSVPARHAAPHPGALAAVYMLLFLAGLSAVSRLGAPFGVKPPYFPGPWQPAEVISKYFQTHGAAVRLCASLQVGAMIPLGIFTATVVSRLRFLGITAAGATIALFGGFMTVFDSTVSHMTMWVMTLPVVNHNPLFLPPLYFVAYAFGGPGFSIPMGLLIAGISITSAFTGLLPKWIVASGILLAVIGELSWLHLPFFPKFVLLIPLTRFPGFLWLIAAGFALPASRSKGKVASPGPAKAD
jgi:hypothetical protein